MCPSLSLHSVQTRRSKASVRAIGKGHLSVRRHGSTPNACKTLILRRLLCRLHAVSALGSIQRPVSTGHARDWRPWKGYHPGNARPVAHDAYKDGFVRTLKSAEILRLSRTAPSFPMSRYAASCKRFVPAPAKNTLPSPSATNTVPILWHGYACADTACQHRCWCFHRFDLGSRCWTTLCDLPC
jgi:hypothetical protein